MAEWINSGEWPENDSEKSFIQDVLLPDDLPADRYQFWSNQYPKGTAQPGRVPRETDIVMLGPAHVWVVSIKGSRYPVELGVNNYLINGFQPTDRVNPWRDVDSLAKRMKGIIQERNRSGFFLELQDLYFQGMVVYETPSLKSDGSLEICSFDQFVHRVGEIEKKNSERQARRRTKRRASATVVQALTDAFGLFDTHKEGRNYRGESWGHYSWQEEGDEPPSRLTISEKWGDSRAELSILRSYAEANHTYDEKPYMVVISEKERVTSQSESDDDIRSGLLEKLLSHKENVNFRLEEAGLRRQTSWLLTPCDVGRREVGTGFVEVWERTKFDLYKDKSNLSLERAFALRRLTEESDKRKLLTDLCEIVRSLLNANYPHGELDLTRVLLDGEGAVYITEIDVMKRRTSVGSRALKGSEGAAERDCMFLGDLMGELWGEIPAELKAAHELLLSGDRSGVDLLADSLAGHPETESERPPTEQPEPLGFEEWRGRLRACVAVVEFGGSISRSEMALELKRQGVASGDEVVEVSLVDGLLEGLPEDHLTLASPGIEFLQDEHARRRSSATPR